jgi:hypothetical protein
LSTLTSVQFSSLFFLNKLSFLFFFFLVLLAAA